MKYGLEDNRIKLMKKEDLKRVKDVEKWEKIVEEESEKEECRIEDKEEIKLNGREENIDDEDLGEGFN